MNLRTLKKLSKRAAILLPLLGDTRQQFRSERGDNYHGYFIGDRKHWRRSTVHPAYKARNEYRTHRGGEIVFTSRTGRRKLMAPPCHPRKGTMMVGATTGYYEPEWDEECAWSALDNLVRGHFTDWEKMMEEDTPRGSALTRDLSTPSLILAAANDMIAERRGSNA